jgi:hypothetical protein
MAELGPVDGERLWRLASRRAHDLAERRGDSRSAVWYGSLDIAARGE